MEPRCREELGKSDNKEGATVIKKNRKLRVTEPAASKMICPGIAISSSVPDLGLWREYQNLLLN